ncbi:hypothetical protein IC608_15025 [Devosia sp. PTR5]|uniref:Uncharacterized protein n=1 Tax=Devosia oryzisoli TaxID=2774138 RepID=A0A927FUY8_9HYPH|nr:hypothetical protein [Devosia oryzisoli]MBD8066785.1 hypothetical protein [Devosia oryzisoli]
MRTYLFAAFAVLPGLFVSSAMAAPVPGFDQLYAQNFTACTLPDGTVADCEAAIQEHVAALVAASVDVDTANASFTALRREVFLANAADEVFQAEIDALFELLLPESGDIGAPGAGAAGGDGGAGGGAGSLTDSTDGDPTPASAG